MLADFEAAHRSDADAIGEFPFLRPDGTFRQVVMAATPLHNADRKTAGYVGSITDVTELKKAEAEHLRLEDRLQQARRLESLGVLAGGVRTTSTTCSSGCSATLPWRWASWHQALPLGAASSRSSSRPAAPPS